MRVLLKYLRPYSVLLLVSLGLAAVAQVLTLLDPVIFGKIIDEYALNPDARPESALVRGAVWWLLVAFGIALLARLARTFQDYVLEKGRIVESGSHDALVERRGLYYAMWRQQIGERETPTRAQRPVAPAMDEALAVSLGFES